MKYYYYATHKRDPSLIDNRFTSLYFLSKFSHETKIPGTDEIFVYSVEIDKEFVTNDDFISYDDEKKTLQFTFQKKINTNIKLIRENLSSVIDNEMIVTFTGYMCGSPSTVFRMENIYYKILNNGLNNNAKELYDIIHDYTYSDWYDINCEGYLYYNIMAYLRNNFESMKNIKDAYDK